MVGDVLDFGSERDAVVVEEAGVTEVCTDDFSKLSIL